MDKKLRLKALLCCFVLLVVVTKMFLSAGRCYFYIRQWSYYLLPDPINSMEILTNDPSALDNQCGQ